MCRCKNKRGFTLIELLAVFVVLAILTLIAVPTIANIINDSQKGSFKASMQNIRDAANFYVGQSMLNGDIEMDSCIYFSFDDDKEGDYVVDGELRTYALVSSLDLKGELPTKGEVKACTNSVQINVCNDRFCGNSTDEEYNVVEGDMSEADTTKPVINDILVTKKTTSTVEIVVDATNPNQYGEITKYYYSLDGKNYDETSKNNFLFERLAVDTDYTIYVKVKNAGGKVSEKQIDVRTATFDEISFSVSPSGWSYNKKVVIEGDTESATLQYKVVRYDENGNAISTEWTEYQKTIFLDDPASTAKPIIVYARFIDGTNISGEKTRIIATIDRTAPSLITRTPSTTENSISIEFVAFDPESDITETICEYGTDNNYGQKGTIKGNTCVISGLSANMSYSYHITTTNGVNLTAESSGAVTTINFPEIGIVIEPTDWSDEKTVTLTGTADGAKLEYKVRKYNESTFVLEESSWMEYTGSFKLDTFANQSYPTTVIARFNDGFSISNEKTTIITNIDTDKPNISITDISTTTQSATIMYTLSDNTSFINNYTCEYGKDTSYGKEGTSSETSCILSNLDKEQTYYYRITVTDVVGNSKVYESNIATGTVDIIFNLEQNTEDTGYASSKDLTVNYISYKVTNPSYYFKATTDATVASDVYSCGTSSQPDTCSSIGTTSLVANTWYLLSGTVINANFTSEGTAYAMIHDGDSYLTASTITVSFDTSDS